MTPEYQPEEDVYPVVWARVFLGAHSGHGGWWHDQGQPVCVCGVVLAEAAPVLEEAGV